jgi:hypothetical protein
MTQASSSCRKKIPVAIVASLGMTSLWFWLTWRYGFDLADEGYYWYGAQRVLHGEVPMRDFMSYDIGRYYWAAFFMHLINNDGIFGARISAVIYQVFGTILGVYVCLLPLRHEGAVRWIFALLVACILTVWVVPYYKAYDHATSIMLVAALALILQSAKPSAWMVSGICLGVAATMGRNHGVYGAASAMLVISMLLIKSRSPRAVIVLYGYFAFGVLIGFSPTLIMMLAIDGFAIAFVDSIVMMLQYGSTNIGLPVPWPWTARLEGIGIAMAAVQLSVGMAFVFLLAFPAIGLLALTRHRFDVSDNARYVSLAAIAAAIPYAHYSFSRADVTHLSLGILPALIGLLAASGTMKGLRPLLLAICLFAVSVVTVSDSNTYLSARLLKRNLVQSTIDGQKIWMFPGIYKRFQESTKALSDQVGGVATFLAVPDMTGLYAIYRAKIPIWEIYPLIPRDTEFEVREIKRLDSSVPNLVLLSEHALDGNPEFRYSQTHPMIYAWVLSRYQLSDGGERFSKSDFRVYSLKH